MSINLSCSSDSGRALPRRQQRLEREVQDYLGLQLRLADEERGAWPIPEPLSALAAQLDHLLTLKNEAGLSEFRNGVLNFRPNLRAFALSLTKNPDRADDLVQETLFRAFNKRAYFQPGTNLNAWLFTILRNSFCSDLRKRAHEIADSDGDYAAQLTTAPDQMDNLNLQDMQVALERIDPDQRQALLLVAVQGLSYEAAALVCRAPVGTIKSRVNRARARLADLLGYTAEDFARDRLQRAPADRSS